jgi:DNA-binding transcriptional regulator YhcF (GntR family)
MAERRDEIADTIRQRIISGLHLGTLMPGARLPSTREIAEEFDVAPRTVMAAYRLLEAEGLVELRERSGIYVAPGHAGATTMLTQLASWVVDVLVEARAREIPPIAFPERVRRCLETLRLRAVCVAGSADQIEQICYELQHDYGIESEGLEPRQLASPDAEAQRALTQADLLVSTAMHATQVQHAARGLGKPVVTFALRPELMSEVTRQLAQGPVYFVASDARSRDVMRTVMEPTGVAANLRIAIVGEDDLATIPPNVPVYITGRAHRQLGDSALARRLVPVRRVFSREMARELLTFIIRANIAALAARAA